MGWTYGVMGETQITASRANIPPPILAYMVNEKIICQNFTAIYAQEGWLLMVFDKEMLQMK